MLKLKDLEFSEVLELDYFIYGSNGGVAVEKDVDIDVNTDLDTDVDIDIDKDLDVDSDFDSDVDISGNLASVTFDNTASLDTTITTSIEYRNGHWGGSVTISLSF